MTHVYTRWEKNERVIQLSKKWMVLSDGVQWILANQHKNRENPVAYIAGTKKSLLDVIRRNDAVVTKRAAKVLGNLPDTFTEWVVKAEKRGLGQKP